MKRGEIACRAVLHCMLLLEHSAEFGCLSRDITFHIIKPFRGKNVKYAFKDKGQLRKCDGKI